MGSTEDVERKEKEDMDNYPTSVDEAECVLEGKSEGNCKQNHMGQFMEIPKPDSPLSELDIEGTSLNNDHLYMVLADVSSGD